MIPEPFFENLMLNVHTCTHNINYKMNIPHKTNMFKYKDCNFIHRFDTCMCHKEKKSHIAYVFDNSLSYSTRDEPNSLARDKCSCMLKAKGLRSI